MGPEHEVEYSTILHADGLQTSSLTLRFRVSETDFKDEKITLKCTASISEVYKVNNEAQLVVHSFGHHQQSSGFHVSENLSQGM